MRRRAGLAITVTSLALVLGVFLVVPLAAILGRAFAGAGAPIAAELAEPGTLEALAATLFIGLAVTAIATPTGTALAWLVERTDLLATERARARVLAILSLPVAVPPYLLAIAWGLLGSGKSGLFNRVGSAPWIDLHGLDGIVLVEATAAYPFVLLAVRAALARTDPALEEAARVFGAGPGRVLRAVTLPLVLPAIATSGALVFVYTTASFAVPYTLGQAASPPVRVMTTRIYQLTTLGGPDLLDRAAALSVVLVALAVLAQGLGAWIARRRSVVQVSGKISRPSLVRLGGYRAPARAGVGAFTLIVIAVPLFTIVWTSFQRSFARPDELTLAHWSAVLGRSETMRAFGHSLLLALAAGALVAAVGLWLARTAKTGGLVGEVLARLAAAAYAIPGTVIAIGMILAFAAEVRLIVLERVTFVLDLAGTLGILLAAYAVKYLAFGISGSRAALDQLHPSLEEAARISGAGPTRSFLDVVLPLVAPAVGAAFVLVALPCLSELTMSVLLFGAGLETAGTLLFELQSYADPPAAAVIAAMIVAFVLAGDALARRLQRATGRGT